MRWQSSFDKEEYQLSLDRLDAKEIVFILLTDNGWMSMVI
jgi:hypothetical protein